MIRSEVVKVRRSGRGTITGGTPNRFARDILSDVVGDLVKVNETRDVRISVEIVGEKGEEKVGSKAVIERGPGSATGHLSIDGGTSRFWDSVTKDWQPGESRKVKSILFATPDGVPVVEFVETPRERLKRALKESENMVFPEQFRHITKECHVYLAATEEAAKKGGG